MQRKLLLQPLPCHTTESQTQSHFRDASGRPEPVDNAESSPWELPPEVSLKHIGWGLEASAILVIRERFREQLLLTVLTLRKDVTAGQTALSMEGHGPVPVGKRPQASHGGKYD